MPPNQTACIDTGSCSGMEPSATIRQYLYVLLGTCFQSNSMQRNKENRTTIGPGQGQFLHMGSPLLITSQSILPRFQQERGPWRSHFLCHSQSLAQMPQCFAPKSENNLEPLFSCMLCLTARLKPCLL